jgi:hypothetical protein
MPFFGVWPPMMSMCSRRPNRTFIPLSPSGRVIVQVETRSLCAHGTRCPSLASDRRRRGALAVQIGRLCRRSRHGAGRSYKSRCAHCALIVLDAPFGVGPPRRRCALAVHIGRLYTALAIAQGDRQVEMRSICSWFSMPSFASDPPSLSSRRPPLGRLYRSCHRTERFFKSRRAHRALMVLDALFGV